jgi:hypothetical protein
VIDDEILWMRTDLSRLLARPLARSHVVAGAVALLLAVVLILITLSPGGQAATYRTASAGSVACPGGTICVDVNGNADLGPARAIAEGFIHGVDSSTDPSLVSALQPRSWIFSGDPVAYNAAHGSGAAFTFVLSDAWSDATYSAARNGPLPPWEHLDQYAAFVRQTVANARRQGRQVAYWEVQNEPDGFYGGARPTVTQALTQFGVAVQAIRSVDPAAKVEGPNISAFNDRRGSATLDLASFLDYVVATHIRLDALSWHEVGARVSPTYNPPDPYSVLADVSAARALIRARPGLLITPKLFINEYHSADDHLIPGWTVGWMSALEQGGVDSADRACWHGTELTLQRISECREGLDGLLIPGTNVPQAVYWVHRAYAAMGGHKVAVSTNDPGNRAYPTVSAFATIDYASRTMQVLVGRHATCTPAIRDDCRRDKSTPPPTAVQIELDVPWSSTLATAQVQQIPNVPGPVTGPVPALNETIRIGAGPLVVRLPAFNDGDAYTITVKLAA